MPRLEPTCPGCGWHLSFEAVDGRWRALCWNTQPGGCYRAGREVLPPRHWEPETLAVVRRLGLTISSALAAELDLNLSTASERLRKLHRDGTLRRERVGRNAYAYALNGAATHQEG